MSTIERLILDQEARIAAIEEAESRQTAKETTMPPPETFDEFCERVSLPSIERRFFREWLEMKSRGAEDRTSDEWQESLSSWLKHFAAPVW